MHRNLCERPGLEAVAAGGLTSEELAQRARAGCRDSFAVLVERHSPRIFNYLWQMTGNRYDAEDLTQETFLKVFRALRRYDAPRIFMAWLFTIARRTAQNHFRAARPAQEVTPEMQTSTEDPALVAMARDEWRSLWDLARTFRREQYEALWLRYAEELSIAEIARVMKLSSIHVRVLLHRGRQQLMKRLAVGRIPSSEPIARGFNRPASATDRVQPSRID